MDISDCSCEPMDIDMSVNSDKSLEGFGYSTSAKVQPQVTISPEKLKQRDISSRKGRATDTATKGKVEWKIKKFHLKKEPLASKKKFLHEKWIIALAVLCFSMIGYYVTNTSCIEELKLDLIEQALTTKLYGQNFVVEQVVKTLKLKTGSKIIFFYGGTGVGKTYTASLILKGSWNYSNIYHFTMPSFANTFTTNILSGLILCKSTMMVVDNLGQDDMKAIAHIKEVVEKSEYLGKNLTIFLIYNCDTVSAEFVRNCDSTFLAKLQENYREIKAMKTFIKFETLTDEELRKCIRDEIGYRTVTEAQMTEILKNFDVSSDGCKGVHTKIKFLNLL